MKAAFLFILLAACDAPKPHAQLSASEVVVSSNANLRIGPIGEEQEAAAASFVLVDAENRSTHDAYVTLVGEFADADGHAIVGLRPEELFIPAGQSRTYALVDEKLRSEPNAKGAQVRVRTASVASFAPSVHVSDLNVFHDQGRAVVAANITNEIDKTAQVVVLAAFHDAAGKPLIRPFQVMPMGGKVTKVARFVGPPGSTDGTIYIGEVTY